MTGEMYDLHDNYQKALANSDGFDDDALEAAVKLNQAWNALKEAHANRT